MQEILIKWTRSPTVPGLRTADIKAGTQEFRLELHSLGNGEWEVSAHSLPLSAVPAISTEPVKFHSDDPDKTGNDAAFAVASFFLCNNARLAAANAISRAALVAAQNADLMFKKIADVIPEHVINVCFDDTRRRAIHAAFAKDPNPHLARPATNAEIEDWLLGVIDETVTVWKSGSFPEEKEAS